MTHLPLHSTPTGSSGLQAVTVVSAGIGRVITRIGRFIAAEIDRRRTMQLLGSDDRMLADIGITRADVYAAILTEGGNRASERLAGLRRDRREAARAQAEEARSADR